MNASTARSQDTLRRTVAKRSPTMPKQRAAEEANAAAMSRLPTLLTFSTMTTEQKDDMLIKHMQSKAFLEKDDDKKLDWVAKIAPKGF